MDENGGYLRRALDDVRDAIAAKAREVAELRAQLAAKEADLEELRRVQVQFWNRLTSEERPRRGRPTVARIEDLPPPVPLVDGPLEPVGDPSTPRCPAATAPADEPAARPPSGANVDKAPSRRAVVEGLQALSDEEDARERALFAEAFRDMSPSIDGEAPKGFASAVRQVAHRSIFLAGRPLRRNDIAAEVERAGIPLPGRNAGMKITKILVRDPDLTHDEQGYSLSDEARKRQAKPPAEAEARGPQDVSHDAAQDGRG